MVYSHNSTTKNSSITKKIKTQDNKFMYSLATQEIHYHNITYFSLAHIYL
ncbi:hypothetical protein Hdeb2414_s0001g00033711 [Helianthus debilis subsp. tardiflorus]